MNIDFGREGAEQVSGADCKVEEEKKEGTPKRPGFEASAGGSFETRRAALAGAQEGLPSELKYPAAFTREQDLLDQLERLGASDLQVEWVITNG